MSVPRPTWSTPTVSMSRTVLATNSSKLALKPLGHAPITPPVLATSFAWSTLMARAASRRASSILRMLCERMSGAEVCEATSRTVSNDACATSITIPFAVSRLTTAFPAADSPPC